MGQFLCVTDCLVAVQQYIQCKGDSIRLGIENYRGKLFNCGSATKGNNKKIK